MTRATTLVLMYLEKASLDELNIFSRKISDEKLKREHTQHAPSAVLELLRAGNKLEAVKAYKLATGLGLKESKDAIDAMYAMIQTVDNKI